MLRHTNFIRTNPTTEWFSRRIVCARNQRNFSSWWRFNSHPITKRSLAGSTKPGLCSVLDDNREYVVASDRSIKQASKQVVMKGVQTALPAFSGEVLINETSKVSFGDYQCSCAMQLFATLPPDTKYSSPRDLAQSIVDALNLGDVYEKAEVAGPGFINLFLSTDYILDQSRKLLSAFTTAPKVRNKKKVIVDFSSPNIAKEMHVGHLRSTIIGDSLCRALEYRGYDVSRLNHVGDWGTQFGMLITYMRDHGSESTELVSDLQSLYKLAKIKFDTDADFKLRSQEAVTKLQSYDTDTKRTWEKICEASRVEFKAIYELLDIEIEERGESFYNEMIPDTLADLVTKGIAVQDDGALCIFTEGSPVPLICKKSDGGFNYASTDLAALRHRTQVENADWIIYVTDVSQRSHFNALFDAGSRAGWLKNPKSVAVSHVGFGLVTGEDGKRLRTRSGEAVRLKDLLLEAKERCLQQFQQRNANYDIQTIESSALDMGIGAVKYADLRNNISTNYTFSFDRMLDLKGNTAVYLQYTYARINSITQRATEERKMSTPTVKPCINSSERALMLHLLRFDDAVDTMIDELMPSKLCEYVYTLCVLFNNFYAESKIFGSDEEDVRLMMCSLSLEILSTCFTILGIRAVGKI